MKILALGGSTSSQSINRQLAAHAAGLVPHADVTVADLRDYETPLFSVDAEEKEGVPEAAQRFLELIKSHDALVVSLAEHNGSYAAAFKNLYDWASRAQYEVWQGKPMVLMATSPGARGGAGVLAAAEATFPRMGAELRATFSLPSFGENFDAESGITDPALAEKLRAALARL
ncbi:MAG: NADPH-dependent FMN reductase [Verrucomicrobiales bacterium]